MGILLVEDNHFNRDMLARRLIWRGYRVTCAVDGESGVRLAREQHPRLILMDIGLPGIDGWEAIRQLKSMPETQEIPIIALTGHAYGEDRDRASRDGCAGFVSKPIDFKYLLDTINKLVPREP